MRRVLTIAIALALGFALAAALGLGAARNWLSEPIAALTQETSYEVPRGASMMTLARDLQARGLIAHPRVLAAWAQFAHKATSIKAGEYQLTPGLSPMGLLDLFTTGKVILHSITFVEGSTFAEVRKQLVNHPDIVATLAQTADEGVMEKLGLHGLHPEGQFFPDTYYFPKGTSDLELLGIAHRRMQTELESVWSQRAADLRLAAPYEALILASIVEKETALAAERSKIAGVFLERLQRGMRLQTDPTVIYGLGESYDGNIHKADLLRDTPYNTYTRDGLPPTPICLPGLESLRAAVNPERSGALFFVATGAGDGSHYFSQTMREHNLAVRRYLQSLHAQSKS